MNQSIYYLIAAILCCFKLSAKTTIDRYSLEKDKISPSEIRYNEFRFNTESQMIKHYLKNPVFEHIIKMDSNEYKELSRSYIASNGSLGNIKGDYLLTEGNQFENYAIDGYGSINLKEYGTLFGHVSYAKGIDKNIGWNAIRHPQLYAPYITTDSLGGDSKYDFYNIKGGYSFAINKLLLGFSGHFKGEQAYRLTDPRLVNTTTWIQTNVGIGYKDRNQIALLSFGYVRNKQYQSLRYWRPGQQDRFFVSYGFGLYDVKHSRVSFGYSRMYYIDGFNSVLSYEKKIAQYVSLSLGCNIQYDQMKTEEADIRDLYKAKTTQILPNFMLSWGKRNNFTLYGELEYSKRIGYENIFEQYLVDDVNNVYDFRLINSQQNYKYNHMKWLIQVKYNLSFHRLHNLSLSAGTYGLSRQEKYKVGSHHIRNNWIEPHIGIGYLFLSNKNEFSASSILSKKRIIKNSYQVNLQSDKIEYLDFQHAFAPYAYYSSSYDAIKWEISYTRHMKPLSIGIRCEGFIRDGKRDATAVYERKIGFKSSAPLISKSQDIYNERWGNMALFVLF